MAPWLVAAYYISLHLAWCVCNDTTIQCSVFSVLPPTVHIHIHIHTHPHTHTHTHTLTLTHTLTCTHTCTCHSVCQSTVSPRRRILWLPLRSASSSPTSCWRRRSSTLSPHKTSFRRLCRRHSVPSRTAPLPSLTSSQTPSSTPSPGEACVDVAIHTCQAT